MIEKATTAAGASTLRTPVRFAPAVRVSMAQHVLDQLLAEVREGRLKPGERLPAEHELMVAFAVGRSTIREALRGLITLGLVENRAGRGAIVTFQARSPLAHIQRATDIEQLNKRALLDLLEVREGLEGKAAEFAAQRANPEELRELQRHHAAVKRDVERQRSYFRANTAFHKAIAASAHNPVLSESISLLIGQVRDFRERLMRQIPVMPQRDVIEHAAVVDAICRGDPNGAREAMVAHIRSFAQSIEQMDLPAFETP
jgi:GntR family transcriptional regulator, transcriptional repressor for pyruvate dehydrogenase complex